MSAPAKVTYVSLSADNPEVRAGFDAAIAAGRAAQLGATHPLRIAGEPRAGADDDRTAAAPPTRASSCARVASGTAADVDDAVAAARAAFPAWSRTPWTERARAASSAPPTSSAQRRYELSAWLICEMGKNRVEALGEIEETADLLTYYAAADARATAATCARWASWRRPTATPACCARTACGRSIAPWNFPYALHGRAGRRRRCSPATPWS